MKCLNLENHWFIFFSPPPVKTNFVTKIVLRIVYFFFQKDIEISMKHYSLI